MMVIAMMTRMVDDDGDYNDDGDHNDGGEHD